MANYKIAIVGSRDAVRGFALLGVDVVPVENPDDAMDTLMKLKKETVAEGKNERPIYAIIFVTEDLVDELSPDDQKKLARGALPAIIPLPSHQGSTGFGLRRLKAIVEQAVGSDILQ